MKNTNLSGVLICLTFFFLAVSCDTNLDTSQVKSGNPGEQILPRVPLDGCEDCPIGCCCCGIERISGAGTLEFCGLCEGDYVCGTYSPGAPCSSISGVGKDIMLSSLHPREVFCVEPAASFRIYNPGTTSITFRFTCEYDQIPPPFQTVTIQAHSELFFHNDGSCITEGC